MERRFEAELQGLRAQQRRELRALEERLRARHRAETGSLRAEQRAELEELRARQQDQVCVCFDKVSYVPPQKLIVWLSRNLIGIFQQQRCYSGQSTDPH